MRTPAQADLKRWSDDVARDPRSLAFLPLARAYRRRGLGEEAIQLCLRGLEAYPTHVEAHGLLALLHLDRGDHQKAADEWSIVLRMDRDNFEALRGLGFCFLEQDRLSRARQMLERAALLRPTEPTVQEALRLLGTRQELAESGIGSKPQLTAEQAAWAHELPPAAPVRFAFAGPPQDGHAGAGVPAADVPAADPGDSGAQPLLSMSGHADAEPLPADPERLFDGLLAAGPVLVALFVDAQGLVLAGRVGDGPGTEAALLGAVLGGAAGEAARTASHLSLGHWRGIHLEAADALVQLVPTGAGGVVVLAARRSTPAGWLRRAAWHAADRARRYLEAYG
jgi:tetratricopeptide (TPR) repeat protein